MKKSELPVIITTEHRGVFFGYIDESKKKDTVITVRRARNVIYWTADVRGFMGLAALGPTSGCRIGPAVEEVELHKVTSLLKVSTEALVKWEALK